MRLSSMVLFCLTQSVMLGACKRSANDGQENSIFSKPTESRETRYDNGQIKERFHVAKDATGSYQKHGNYEFFYANGQKGEEGSFADDEKVGAWTSWHDNGKVESKGTFLKGKLDGEVSDYDSDGVLSLKRAWKAGNSHGPIEIHQRGKPLVRGQYANGLADGTWVVLNASGDKLGEVQMATGEYLGKVKNDLERAPATAESSCDTVLGFRLGASTYADTKLGFLTRGDVPGELHEPSGATKGPIIVLANPSDYGLELVKKAYFVFDNDGTLVAVTLVMPKDRPTKYGAGFGGNFKLVKEDLADKFKLTEQQVPFVGNAFAKFQSPACTVTLDAPHLSFQMTLNYSLKGHENAVVAVSD